MRDKSCFAYSNGVKISSMSVLQGIHQWEVTQQPYHAVLATRVAWDCDRAVSKSSHWPDIHLTDTSGCTVTDLYLSSACIQKAQKKSCLASIYVDHDAAAADSRLHFKFSRFIWDACHGEWLLQWSSRYVGAQVTTLRSHLCHCLCRAQLLT